MKTLKKICAWGGVSLLIVALVVSLCLVTLPVRANANNANHAAIGSADNEAVVWQTLYLNGDWDKFTLDYQQVVGGGAEWLRVVMQVDIVAYIPNVYAYDYLKGIVWDLNGHSVTYSGGDLNFRGFKYVEITDTSAAGNGYIQHAKENSDYGTVDFYDCGLVILSGGSIIGYLNSVTPANGLMVGGKIVRDGNPSYGWKNFTSLIVAPYIHNPDNYNYYVPDGNTGICVLSKTTSCMGVYNYEFGVNFPGNNCLLANITQKRPYYLYSRASNQTWFNDVWYTFPPLM